MHLGDFRGSQVLLEDSLAVAQQVGDPRRAADALHSLARLAYVRGDPEAVRLLSQQGLEAHRALGDQLGVAYSPHLLGLAAALEGNFGSARRYSEEGLTMSREMGDKQGIAAALDNLGDVALRQAQHRLARSRYAESLALASELGDRRRIAFGIQGFARLASAQGQPRRALRLAGAADVLHEAVGMTRPRPWQERVESSLKPSRRALGEPAAAAATAAGRAMSQDEAVAYALGLTEPAPRETHDTPAVVGDATTPLTSREREVAGLVARGLTNRQIGSELVITAGTAGLHVKHILGKLGFTSRAQIAVWVVERGLAASRPER